jgi:hypothetical protein
LSSECVAEYTRRPLLSLTCSDIGVDPNTVESQLIKYFKLAKQWGAILLIDEADIYMEKRVSQDLQRNSLVAGGSVKRIRRGIKPNDLKRRILESNGALSRIAVPYYQSGWGLR